MDCHKCFEIIKNGNLIDWEGLPDSCILDDFKKNFKQVSSHLGRGFLGRRNIPIYFGVFKGWNYYKSLRVWVTENRQIKMIEIEFPSKINLREIRREFGESLNKSDYYIEEILVECGEFIYNDRGISLMLNADHDRILKILLYSPIPFERYQDEISFPVASKEF